MNEKTIGIIVGILIILNILGITLEWLRVKTNIIKLNEKVMNIIYILISMCGGFVGVLLGAEMLGIKEDNKIFKKIIPTIIIIEIIVIIYIYYVNNG